MEEFKMKKEEIEYLSQIAKSLGEVEPQLERAYNQKDAENFNKIKRFVLQAQKKISEVIK